MSELTLEARVSNLVILEILAHQLSYRQIRYTHRRTIRWKQ